MSGLVDSICGLRWHSAHCNSDETKKRSLPAYLCQSL